MTFILKLGLKMFLHTKKYHATFADGKNRAQQSIYNGGLCENEGKEKDQQTYRCLTSHYSIPEVKLNQYS